MKTDYRVICCCIVAWLCCATVTCHREWNNVEWNNIDDYQPEYDKDEVSDILSKEYDDAGWKLHREEEVDDTKCEEACGKDYKTKTDILCDGNIDPIECICPDEGFVFDYDRKICELCDCGDGSKGCSFKVSKKTCECKENYAQKGDKCEACGCGVNSDECSFEGGKKTCQCKQGFVQDGDTCEDEKECNSICGEERLENAVKCVGVPATGGVDCVCEESSKGFDYDNKICTACDCGVNSDGCSFEGGVKACNCKNGFAQNGDTCEACGCGDGSNGCSFKDSIKTCKCNATYAQKEDKCEACGCGVNSDGCSFEGGVKTCDCKDGFAQNGDICEDERCDSMCGEKRLENAVKCVAVTDGVDCVCTDNSKGFDYNNKNCTACDCGDGSNGCSFKDSKKTCKCNANFGQKGAKCEACDCGDNSVGCIFEGDEKTCNCKKGFAQNGETCEDENCNSACGEGRRKIGVKCIAVTNGVDCACEDSSKGFDYIFKNCTACSCGDSSTGCSFKEGAKTCKCKAKSAQKGEKCEACVCGDNSNGCSFDGDKKTCKCNTNSAQKGDKCEPCGCGDNSNGCSYDGDKKTCQCHENSAQQEEKCQACGCGENSDGCSFSGDQKTCKCQKGFAQNDETCQACDCGTNSKECSFHENQIVCKCETGFGQKGEKCAACDCGAGVNNCSFVGDEQTCTCKFNYGLKNGKCEKCDCGEGVKYCSFHDEEGQICVCQEEKYALKDKKCAACNCGVGVKSCSFEEDKTVCACKEKYALKKEICAACDCGDFAKSCRFDGDQKLCDCKENYAVKDGTCTACDCGDGANSCYFDGGIQKCLCKEDHGLKDGKCAKCDCGDGAKSCTFDDGGKKTCICKEKHAVKDGKCVACECGDGAVSCSFDSNNVQLCVCKEKFSLKEGKCAACECGNYSKGCKFEGEKKTCECNSGFGDKLGNCTACACGTESSGCTFEGADKTCLCKARYGDKGGTCTECKCGVNTKSCVFEGDEKACVCNPRYGDKKGTCTDCNCGTNTEGCTFEEEDKKTCHCKNNYDDNNGKCEVDQCKRKCGVSTGVVCSGDKFNVTSVECKCGEDGLKFDPTPKTCREPCEKDDDCTHGAKCAQRGGASFCDCQEGTSGDRCGVVLGCVTGGIYAQCKDEKGTCGYNVKTAKPICVCPAGKKLDEKKGYCEASFCLDSGCSKDSQCVFDEKTKTAYCVCPKGKYYDYQINGCVGPDKCLLKKTACKENEVCEDGECKCAYEIDEEKKCIRQLCKPDPCFTGAKCKDDDGSCFCEEGKTFTGSKCEDKNCLLDGFEEKCKCPSGMERKEGAKKCEPTSGKACDKDCGYGYCVDDACKCVDAAEKVKDKCELPKSICASGKLTEDLSKCNCTGKYKLAKDGKTCELVTCADDAAKNDCASKGATCVMVWKGTPEYQCKCPDGYDMDNERQICTDPCSIQKNIAECLKKTMFCYNSNSKENLKTGDCKCPPPFTSQNNECTGLDGNMHLITNIPVLKKSYEMQSGIDYVRLNDHLIQSLKQTFSTNSFDYGYLNDYDVGEKVIKCSAWVRFKTNPVDELKRIPFQAQKFTEGTCEDCDTSLYVWPPALLLSEKDMDEVGYEKLTLCTTTTKDRLCGKDATCKDNKCDCPRGYRTLEYTVRESVDKKFRIQRCEATSKVDLDDCVMGTHKCSKNTTCLKIPGDYICTCKPGYRKDTENDKNDCFDLCSASPCVKGACSMKKSAFNCQCEPGYGGSLCDAMDVNFASAKKSTVVVGAVLGTILIVGILAFLLYYRKLRKSSYSEDFAPAPRIDRAEMTERRPMRGVVNKSYE